MKRRNSETREKTGAQYEGARWPCHALELNVKGSHDTLADAGGLKVYESMRNSSDCKNKGVFRGKKFYGWLVLEKEESVRVGKEKKKKKKTPQG